jgi:predicted amidohydrolase
MIGDLKVTLVQTDLIWEDIELNIAGIDRQLDRMNQDTHLIVLPEMFTTGFTMNAENLAQGMDGDSIHWLQTKSRQKNADIVGSVVIKDGHKFFNRLLWAKPNGELFAYDKKHLFRMAGEEKVYHSGDKRITVVLRGWKIRPFICYDLRFPAWTRNVANHYDLAVFVANWPESRSSHWKILLQARAIENQCYVIGVNRVGKDGNGLSYSGDSSIIDPLGKILFRKSFDPCTHTATLSYSDLFEYRESFPVWMDAGERIAE